MKLILFFLSALPWILFVRYVYLETGEWKYAAMWWAALAVIGLIEKATQQPKYAWSYQPPFFERPAIVPSVLAWLTFGFAINSWLETVFWGSLLAVVMIWFSIYAYSKMR